MVQPECARSLEVGGRDFGDALAVHVVGGHPGVEGDGGQDGGLGGCVVSLDVGGGVGLGVAQRARVGQRVGVVGAGAVHLREDVVGGAVDDARHPQHGVTGEGLGQRADDRDRAGHGGLEIQVDMGMLGGLGQLAGGLRHQRLVGGHDGLAVFEGGQYRLAGRFDGAHHLDDDVDVVTGDQRVDVVGEQLDRHTAVIGHPPHADAAQHQRRTDARRQVVGAVLDDPDHLAADIAQPQDRYADRLLVHSYLTSRLSRSSTVSRRRIRRARPSRTATTAGRPIRL